MDKIVTRTTLRKALGVSGETMRQWIIKGKLPKPDVAMSHKTQGWKTSTLKAAGVDVS